MFLMSPLSHTGALCFSANQRMLYKMGTCSDDRTKHNSAQQNSWHLRNCNEINRKEMEARKHQWHLCYNWRRASFNRSKLEHFLKMYIAQMHEAFWKQLQRLFEADWDSRKYERCHVGCRVWWKWTSWSRK